jgi:hypothetical protein
MRFIIGFVIASSLLGASARAEGVVTDPAEAEPEVPAGEAALSPQERTQRRWLSAAYLQSAAIAGAAGTGAGTILGGFVGGVTGDPAGSAPTLQPLLAGAGGGAALGGVSAAALTYGTSVALDLSEGQARLLSTGALLGGVVGVGIYPTLEHAWFSVAGPPAPSPPFNPFEGTGAVGLAGSAISGSVGVGVGWVSALGIGLLTDVRPATASLLNTAAWLGGASMPWMALLSTVFLHAVPEPWRRRVSHGASYSAFLLAPTALLAGAALTTASLWDLTYVETLLLDAAAVALPAAFLASGLTLGSLVSAGARVFFYDSGWGPGIFTATLVGTAVSAPALAAAGLGLGAAGVAALRAVRGKPLGDIPYLEGVDAQLVVGSALDAAGEVAAIPGVRVTF